MRTLIKLTLFSGLALLGAACASSEKQDPASDQPLAAAQQGRVVRECRYAKATGTKMRTRICYSQETWAALDAANEKEQDTDDFFRRSREMSTTAGNVSVPAIGGPSP